MSDQKFTLKSEFSPEFVAKLANAFSKQFPDFKEKRFQNAILNDQWEDRELKDRMRHIALVLGDVLPSNYKEAVRIVVAVAPEFTGLSAIVFPDFIQVFGLDHFKESIDALQVVTEYSSSEFAVRPYIERYTDEMMAILLEWTNHENEHVRRLASEGCRPRLPWAPALNQFKLDPVPILPILERLRNDESLYVRKSVANNLNDISKDYPELVLAIAEKWLKENHVHTNWIVKQALRGLLKRGDKKALSLFGFGNTDLVKVSKLKLNRSELSIGEKLEFTFQIQWKGKQPVKLRLEYGIDYVKSSGKTNRKVFQIKEIEFIPKENQIIVRRQSFEQRTTRKHYPGKHNLAILVNGDELANQTFLLTA